VVCVFLLLVWFVCFCYSRGLRVSVIGVVCVFLLFAWFCVSVIGVVYLLLLAWLLCCCYYCEVCAVVIVFIFVLLLLVWIVRAVKSRRMSWAGHVVRMGQRRGVYRVLVGKPECKSHWGDPDVDGRIILRWIFKKWEKVVGTGWSWLRIGTGGGQL